MNYNNPNDRRAYLRDWIRQEGIALAAARGLDYVRWQQTLLSTGDMDIKIVVFDREGNEKQLPFPKDTQSRFNEVAEWVLDGGGPPPGQTAAAVQQNEAKPAMAALPKAPTHAHTHAHAGRGR